jgi:hypothetical protein
MVELMQTFEAIVVGNLGTYQDAVDADLKTY